MSIFSACFRSLFLAFITLYSLCASLNSAQLEYPVSGISAVLINAKTGQTILSKNPDITIFPASTTKIATAIYVLSTADDLNQQVEVTSEALRTISGEAKFKKNYKVPAHWLEPDGTHISLRAGEKLPLSSLLEGLMIASANDAANVIALNSAQTVPSFMERLNSFLKKIGCKNTNFLNPHGLHHPDHITTANDLAILAKYALQNENFRNLVKKVKYERPATSLQPAAAYYQGNRLLRRGEFYYPAAIGIKTGYHSKAKRVLVSAAQKNDRRLILVQAGYQERNQIFKEAKAIFETAFNEKLIQQNYLPKGVQKFTVDIPKSNQALKTYTDTDLVYSFYPSEEQHLKSYIEWQTNSLPIKRGEVVGFLKLKNSRNEDVVSVDIKAANDLNYSFFNQMLNKLKFIYQSYFYLIVSFMILSICYLVLPKKK